MFQAVSTREKRIWRPDGKPNGTVRFATACDGKTVTEVIDKEDARSSGRQEKAMLVPSIDNGTIKQ